MTEFRYHEDVAVMAARHGLDPQLVEAVCWIESSGRTHAYRFEPDFWERYLRRSPAYDGANPDRVSASYGLMQVMFPTAVDHGMPPTEPPEYLFVPLVGLEWGCRILAQRLVWAKGDVRKALASYNGGQGNWLGARPQAYADKVLAQWARLQDDTRNA